MSWDVPYFDVSHVTCHEISLTKLRVTEIRSTKTTNVRRESALLLVNYATECVLVATYTG
jgi:glutathione peroxidase-family protein